MFATTFAILMGMAGHVVGQYAITELDLDGDLAAWYDQAIGVDNQKIFEGSYYDLGSPYVEQNQYFQSGQWTTGTISFDGQIYSDVELLYNSYKDEVIIRNQAIHFSIAQPTLLNQQRVEYFQIYDRWFIHLQDDVPPTSGAGFYERIFDSNTIDFYIKRVKNEYIKSGRLVYEEEDRYYISYQGDYTRFTGKKSLYQLLPNQKNKLKSYGKNLKTRIRQDGERDIIVLLKYCDSLLSEK